MINRFGIRWVALVAFLCGCGLVAISQLGATTIQITPQQSSRHGSRYRYPATSRYGATADYQSVDNILLGPLSLGLTGRVAMQYTDNVNYAEDGGREGTAWSLVPELSLRVNYPVSQYVTISTGVSAGFRYYFTGPGEDGFFMASDAGAVAAYLGANVILADDVVIGIHNRLSREVETLEIIDRNRGADYGAWRNTVDVSYSKQLNRSLSATLTYMHEDRWTDNNRYQYQDFSKDGVDLTVLYHLLPSLKAGPYVRFEDTRFHKKMRNNRRTLEAGLSTVGGIREGAALSFTANFGYETVFLANDNDPTAQDDEGGFVATFVTAFTPTVLPGHRLRTSYRRNHEDLNPGINYADELLLGYGVDIRVTDQITVSGDVDWTNIRESDGGEEADIWRFFLRSAFQLTARTDVGFSYRFTTKDSDVGANDFSNNFVELSLTHNF